MSKCQVHDESLDYTTMSLSKKKIDQNIKVCFETIIKPKFPDFELLLELKL